jgi:hypothetical protein
MILQNLDREISSRAVSLAALKSWVEGGGREGGGGKDGEGGGGGGGGGGEDFDLEFVVKAVEIYRGQGITEGAVVLEALRAVKTEIGTPLKERLVFSFVPEIGILFSTWNSRRPFFSRKRPSP